MLLAGYSSTVVQVTVKEISGVAIPLSPVGEKQKNFHKTIRKWARMEEACGPEVLHHKSQNKVWTVEEKYELVAKVFDTFIFHRIVLI